MHSRSRPAAFSSRLGPDRGGGVASFPDAPTVLDTYGYTTDQVESLVRVLFGEVNPAGTLPVSIPRADGTGELYPFGHGLHY